MPKPSIFLGRLYCSLIPFGIVFITGRAFVLCVKGQDPWLAAFCGVICLGAIVFTLWYLFRKGDAV